MPVSFKPPAQASSTSPRTQAPLNSFAGLAATRRGHSYERKVLDYIEDVLGYRIHRQLPLGGGYVDGLVYGDVLRLVEVKASYTPAAWKQLARYAGDRRFAHPTSPPPARVVICRTHYPHLPIPAACRLLRLEQFGEIGHGDFALIPWSGKL